jgi:hypothetical protein
MSSVEIRIKAANTAQEALQCINNATFKMPIALAAILRESMASGCIDEYNEFLYALKELASAGMFLDNLINGKVQP